MNHLPDRRGLPARFGRKAADRYFESQSFFSEAVSTEVASQQSYGESPGIGLKMVVAGQKDHHKPKRCDKHADPTGSWAEFLCL